MADLRLKPHVLVTDPMQDQIIGMRNSEICTSVVPGDNPGEVILFTQYNPLDLSRSQMRKVKVYPANGTNFDVTPNSGGDPVRVDPQVKVDGNVYGVYVWPAGT